MKGSLIVLTMPHFAFLGSGRRREKAREKCTENCQSHRLPYY
jgi:hypothetical protein